MPGLENACRKHSLLHNLFMWNVRSV